MYGNIKVRIVPEHLIYDKPQHIMYGNSCNLVSMR